jgi:hypothetical protein
MKKKSKTPKKKKTKAARLTDKQAKEVLLKWPKRTKTLWRTPKNIGYWIQAQPVTTGTSPTLILPGAKNYKSQPDGLWVYFHDLNFVDIICVEVCNSIQNLNDKRSRYISTASTILLKCPTDWFYGMINVEKENRENKKTRWEASGVISHVDENVKEYKLPIRTIRVLYALKDKDYPDWRDQNVPMAHEYLCSQNSLKSFNSKVFKDFLSQLSISRHSYTKTKKDKSK